MHPSGIVLVTGPTGSGKSTTLAAMVDYINENKPDHILTIEDPIEFVHESKKSLINQREVHRDTLGLSTRRYARHCVKIPISSWLANCATWKPFDLRLTAAETGHLVFGTLHTSSASKTIDRIVDVFPAAEKGDGSRNAVGVIAGGNFANAIEKDRWRPNCSSRNHDWHTSDS